MGKQRYVLCSLLLLGACVDGNPVEIAPPVPAPKLATNSLLPSQMQGNTLNTGALTGQGLTASGLEATSDGRTYLSYMIQCALSSRQTVSSLYLGNTYNYTGAYGLAQDWVSGPLSESASRWVTACVLARLNYYGQLVTISLRGDHPGLGVSDYEAENFQTEEAAFYGNMFGAHGEDHACDGPAQLRGESWGDLAVRRCGQEDPANPGTTYCGLAYNGGCEDVCAGDGDHYSSCAAQTEIITVYLSGTPAP